MKSLWDRSLVKVILIAFNITHLVCATCARARWRRLPYFCEVQSDWRFAGEGLWLCISQQPYSIVFVGMNMDMGQGFEVEESITCERSPFWEACLGKRPFRLWKGVRDVITKSPINFHSFFETRTTTATTADSDLCTILRCSFLSHALRLTLKFRSTAVWPLRSKSSLRRSRQSHQNASPPNFITLRSFCICSIFRTRQKEDRGQ